MKIVELIIDENDDLNGIEAISIVESPAIMEDFIALKDKKPLELAEVDKEKKILMGPLLIPNRPIYRNNAEEEYYIYFSRDTVLKASQKYLKAGNQKNSTLEHQMNIQGLTLVESWIKEDMVHDKSVKYGMDVPLGTWMGSVEGYFADSAESPKDKGIKDELSQESEAQSLIDQLKNLLTELKEPCWDGYKMDGYKMIDGKKVPNCVKIK